MNIRNFIKDTTVWIYLWMISIIAGATIYQWLVIIPEFTRELPTSMIALANSPIKPGNFWGSPVIILGGLLFPILAIILNWKTARRKWLLLAFGFGMVASLVTSAYFIPRLRIMGLMGIPPTADTELLIRTIKEWVFADYFRFALCVIPTFLCALKAATTSGTRIFRKSRMPKVKQEVFAHTKHLQEV